LGIALQLNQQQTKQNAARYTRETKQRNKHNSKPACRRARPSEARQIMPQRKRQNPNPKSLHHYRKLRAEILREQPLCHWCRLKGIHTKATETDHLIERHRGGDDTLENLVPSCKKCNATRGALYKAKKDAKPRTQPKTFLDQSKPLTPSPSVSISQTEQAGEAVIGHALPRLETMPANVAGSYGGAIADWAKRVLDIDLMDWQRHIANQMFSFDDAGQFCAQINLCTVARQQGKSVLLKACLGWMLTDYVAITGEPQTIISVAHKLDLGVNLFQELAPVLEAKYGAKAKWSYGRNELNIGSSRWMVRAAVPSAGHGSSCTALFIDELWDISSETLDIGLLPTQRAQKNPICLMFSTAGDERSEAMSRWQEQGLRAIDTGQNNGLYFASYSPPPELDPMTPQAWAYANPALGIRLALSTLQREAASPNRAGFLRSSCNTWVQSEQAWLMPGTWKRLATEEMPAPGGVAACETSLDDGRYVCIRANTNEAGETIVMVAFVADTSAQFWEQLQRLVEQQPTLHLALSPTLDLNCPPNLVRKRTVVGYREITQMTPLVKNLINEARVKHYGDSQQLAEHIGRAVAVRSNSSIALSSQKSSGAIEMARCTVWAVGLCAKPVARITKPAFATSSQLRSA